MAGRGCTIQLHVLNEDFSNEEMSLPVALHSPLEVLKQQLEELIGIEYDNQVLILCDLTDPERNRDILLTGRDYMSLHACGIKNNSLITIHRLGMPAEVQRQLSVKCTKPRGYDIDKSNIFILNTPITAAQANHSYNGVIFDVEAKGPYEVTVTSISVGGMLGVVRVFARDRPWEANKSTNTSAHWWAHRESVCRVGWELVAEQTCRPSWDKPLEIKFDVPVVLLPHSRRGLYVHSGLPDDLGIQYQSYGQSDVVAEDDHVVLLPGVGHTGSTPFDEQNGWYRSYRGLSGSISYSRKAKGWHPHCHQLFPLPLRESVRQMLLCHLKGSDEEGIISTGAVVSGHGPGLAVIPLHVLYYLMEFMHWDWFADVDISNYDVPAFSMTSANVAASSNSSAAPTRTARLGNEVRQRTRSVVSRMRQAWNAVASSTTTTTISSSSIAVSVSIPGRSLLRLIRSPSQQSSSASVSSPPVTGGGSAVGRRLF